jgi:hypothetical protein
MPDRKLGSRLSGMAQCWVLIDEMRHQLIGRKPLTPAFGKGGAMTSGRILSPPDPPVMRELWCMSTNTGIGKSWTGSQPGRLVTQS